MRGLRQSELYPSVQGEGPHTGEPTIFVRFGGCNMRCPGWPCDTQHAIDPSIWRHNPIVEVDDLLFQIALLPGANICITGGEPFMQPADHLADLVHGLLQRGHTIDVFTNGSFPFPEWIEDTNVCVIMDWKLKGSGEAETGLETRIVNASRLRYKDAIKFVIKDDNDFAEAKKHWEVMKDKCACRFYAGVAWNHLPEAMLVEKILDEDLPWSLNVQVHKYIWPGVEKGI